MKNILLAMVFTAVAVPAFAGQPKVVKENIYLGTYGGANWDDVISTPFTNDNTGVVVGGVLGKHVSSVPGLRFEADVAFRHNEVDLTFGPGFIIDHDTVSVMGNVAYDIPFDGVIRPYVLIGAGYAQSSATFENIALLKLEASGFAWQLGAGAKTDIADGVTLGIGYRYFNAPEIEVFGTNLSDGTNHSVVAELNFALN